MRDRRGEIAVAGVLLLRFTYMFRQPAPSRPARYRTCSSSESLIEHRASIEGPGTPCPPDLLRLSVGVEDSGDLHDDLAQALRRAHNA